MQGRTVDVVTPALLLVASLTLWRAVPPVLYAARAAFWPRATARIVAVHAADDGGSHYVGTRFGRYFQFTVSAERLYVDYEFTVAGTVYEGSTTVNNGPHHRRSA